MAKEPKAVTTDARLISVLSEVLARADGSPSSNIALLSTPRSGSSLLGDRIINTQQLGTPREWINPRHMRAYLQVTGEKQLNLTRYLDLIRKKTVTSNGVFSIKIHVSQYQSLLKSGHDIFELIPFDAVIYVQRRQKLSQALSLAKAQVTDHWNSKVEKPTNYEALVSQITHSDILQSLQFIIAQEDYVASKLASRVTAAAIYEESLRDECRAVIGEIAAAVDAVIDFSNWPTPSVDRQSSSRDDEVLSDLKARLGV